MRADQNYKIILCLKGLEMITERLQQEKYSLSAQEKAVLLRSVSLLLKKMEENRVEVNKINAYIKSPEIKSNYQ